jgi:hypothetical protein
MLACSRNDIKLKIIFSVHNYHKMYIQDLLNEPVPSKQEVMKNVNKFIGLLGYCKANDIDGFSYRFECSDGLYHVVQGIIRMVCTINGESCDGHGYIDFNDDTVNEDIIQRGIYLESFMSQITDDDDSLLVKYRDVGRAVPKWWEKFEEVYAERCENIKKEFGADSEKTKLRLESERCNVVNQRMSTFNMH